MARYTRAPDQARMARSAIETMRLTFPGTEPLPPGPPRGRKVTGPLPEMNEQAAKLARDTSDDQARLEFDTRDIRKDAGDACA